MSKDSASGFVQDEPAQFAVIGNEVSLLPQRLARWCGNATDDHISNFAFGVATNDMDNLRGVHSNSVQPFENWPEQGQTAGLPLFHESFSSHSRPVLKRRVASCRMHRFCQFRRPGSAHPKYISVACNPG